MRKRLSFGLLGALTAASLALIGMLPAEAASRLPVRYDWDLGFVGNLPNAEKAPAGAITYDAAGKLATCKSTGKLPVILVHGTWENQNSNWAAAAPLLKNAGFCVYTFNYGGKKNDVLYGTGSIATSAGQLGVFVDAVRAATGSTQVDLIGHSQGGMMPRYYLKFGNSFTGGAYGRGTAKVRHLIGLAPSNHGTTLSGLATFSDAVGLNPTVAAVQPAAIDQTIGSTFMRKLDTCPAGKPNADICAGDPVNYTVIETNKDEIVTPYRNAFLTPNPAAKGRVTNILVQDGCSVDAIDHLAIVYDSYVYGLVLKALGVSNPASVPGASPSCKFIIPYTGG